MKRISSLNKAIKIKIKELLEFFKNFCKNLKEIFSKDLPAAILNFVAVLIGVMLAFYLEGNRIQEQMYENTEKKLKLMCLEIDGNKELALSKYRTYNKAGFIDVNFFRINDHALKEVLEDDNLYRLLEADEIAALIGYQGLITLVNELNEKYIDYWMTNRGDQFSSSNEIMENLILENTSALLAYLEVVRRENKKYCDDISQSEKIKGRGEDIIYIKEKILSDESYIDQL